MQLINMILSLATSPPLLVLLIVFVVRHEPSLTPIAS